MSRPNTRLLNYTAVAEYRLVNVWTTALPSGQSYSAEPALEILAAAIQTGKTGEHPEINLKTDNNKLLPPGKITRISYDLTKIREDFPTRIDLSFEEFIQKDNPIRFLRKIYDENRSSLLPNGRVAVRFP